METYALIGKNIGYSLSPIMHNAAFKALGIKAKYEIFDIQESELGDFFLRIRKGEISGCNVTIPYKEKALQFVDTLDGLSADIGAINTIAKKGERFCGYNTDYKGFISALKGKGPGDLGFDPKGKSVFIFGAGGAAKAVILGLITSGAKRIAIAEIDNAKAESLASSITKRHKGNSLITVVKDKDKYEEFISKSELLVNATPCGVKKDDPKLFDYRYLHETLFCFDLVYASETLLVKEAKQRAAKVTGGLNMLLYQAGASFTIWTGKEAPFENMKKAVLKNLANRRT
ncbi:MAG: shikimate dehydrogenase [Candidatus Omnitrophica bacterium]|nr:shikimate dehydrogenase [Candidatus Omnitrophota bacterium]